MYEVLGLFILLIVGIVLLGESGTAAAHAMHDRTLQIRIFDYPLIPMSKSTFYFSVIVLFLVEIIQTQYQRRLNTKHKNK
jgi:predicted tellurium resistance membrane protein TerC